MAGSHSEFSPSKADTWINCRGALAYAAALNIGAGGASEDAARGTMKHHVSEQCLRDDSQMEPHAFIGTRYTFDGFTFTFDAEAAEQCAAYVNAIRGRIGRRMVEVHLDTSDVLGVPGQQGTADVIILDRGARCIEVHDAKFGFNLVYADSAQCKVYAAVALEQFDWYEDWNNVLLAIHQPSRDHYDEQVFTVAGIREFAAQARAAAMAGSALIGTSLETIQAALTPGDKQCKWCPARAVCTARGNQMLGLFPVTDARPALAADADDMTRLADYLARAESIERWIADVRADATARLAQGQEIPGWMLGEGRQGNRKWKDECGAEAALGTALPPEKIWNRKLISPADAEKALRKMPQAWAMMQEHIERGAPSMRLMRAGEGKPANVSPVEFGAVE